MSQKYFWRAILFALVANSPIVSAHELGAHVHGIATLQVAVDEKTLTLDFSSPLDNLLGFEHAPHTAAQKTAVRNMANSLNQADKLFRPSADAQCTLQSVKLDSPVLDTLQKTSPRQQEHVHADLDGEFIFSCRQSEQLHDLEVTLFDTFPHLRLLKVEIATLKKQSASLLTPEQRRARW